MADQEEPAVFTTENNEKKEEENDPETESDDSDDEEENDESDGEELFEVERIISRKKKNGAFLYRVRWKNYPPSNDTWEPVENLSVVEDMVREYDKRQDDKVKSRQEERRLRKLRMEGKKLPGEESSDSNSDSSKEESQLCETTKFFKRLERDKGLVWAQPDLYSKVKSRSSSVSSKKQEDQQKVEAVAPSTPSASVSPSTSPSKPPPAQSSRGRGRGRPRGAASGTGRGRGRPKKTPADTSDDEDDERGSPAKTKGRGRGRGRPPKKKVDKEKDSLSDDSSSSLSSSSDSSAESDMPLNKDKPRDQDSKAASTESSEVKRESDQQASVAAVKTEKQKSQASKKAAKKSNDDKGNSQLTSASKATASKGRGRPPKSAAIVDTSDDSSDDDSKEKPEKKAEEKGDGDLDSSGDDLKQVKEKPKKTQKQKVEKGDGDLDSSDDDLKQVKDKPKKTPKKKVDKVKGDEGGADNSGDDIKKVKEKPKKSPKKKVDEKKSDGDGKGSDNDLKKAKEKTDDVKIKEKPKKMPQKMVDKEKGEGNENSSDGELKKVKEKPKKTPKKKVDDKKGDADGKGNDNDLKKAKEKTKEKTTKMKINKEKCDGDVDSDTHNKVKEKPKKSSQKKTDKEKEDGGGDSCDDKAKEKPKKSSENKTDKEKGDGDGGDDDAPNKVKEKPKNLSKKKADEEKCDGGGDGDKPDSVEPKKQGRGRPPKKRARDSSDENDDHQSSAPKTSEGPQKDKTADEEYIDNQASDVSPVKKKQKKAKGRPLKNVLSSLSEASESDSAETAAKSKSTDQVEKDSQLSDSSPVEKKKAKGRPAKKMLSDLSEDGISDSAATAVENNSTEQVEKDSQASDKSNQAPVKKKGKGRGRPPKKVLSDLSEDSEFDSDDAAEKSKFTDQAVKVNASDVSTVKKKKGKGRGRPPKKVLSDLSDDSESDDPNAAEKSNSIDKVTQSFSVHKKDTADDESSSRKPESISKKSDSVPSKEEPEDDKQCAVPEKPKKITKTGKNKSAKKMIIKDSDEEMKSDDSSVHKETPEPSHISEEKKKKAKKTKNNSDKVTKQTKASSEKKAKKTTKSKSAKTSTDAGNTTECQSVPSQPKAMEIETKSEPTEDTPPAEKAVPDAPTSGLSTESEKQSTSKAALTTPTPASRAGSKAVIPLLEKLANNFLLDTPASQDAGDAESTMSAAAAERVESKNTDKKAQVSKKESKETTDSEKSSSKGVKKGLKRKLDTAVEHCKAAKEAKVASPRPPDSPADASSVTKHPSSSLPESSCSAAVDPTSSSAPSPSIASDIAAAPSAFSKDVITDTVAEDARRVPSPVSLKQSMENKVKSSKSKQKVQLLESSRSSSPKSKGSSSKADKQKAEKEKFVDNGAKAAMLHSSEDSSVCDLSAVTEAGKATAQTCTDTSTKPGNEAVKPDVSAKLGSLSSTPEAKVTKSDSGAPCITRPWAMEKTVVLERADNKVGSRTDATDLKRKYSSASDWPYPTGPDSDKLSTVPRTGSTSELAGSGSSDFKVSLIRSCSTTELPTTLGASLLARPALHTQTSSPGCSTPTTTMGRDLLLSPQGKDPPGLLFSSPGSSRDSPGSLYPYSGLGGRLTSWPSTSPSAFPFTGASSLPRDAGSSRDQLTLTRDLSSMSALSHSQAAGLGLSRDSPLGYLSSPSAIRDYALFAPTRLPPTYRDSWSLPSRHDFNANIAGKDFTGKSLFGRSALPSTTTDVDRPRLVKGIDFELGDALRTVDLEYVEKTVLAQVTPMELSHDELRQAVIDGNCYLVERALKCARRYNLDLPDNWGYTLLMNAVVKGCDDIIIHLLTHGANPEAQVKGNTALMLAAQKAECSTVYLLLEMGAKVNSADSSGETALFKAVMRGDKQIIKLMLDHGADFNWTSHANVTPLQMAKQCCLADIDVTLTDHIQRVVGVFEEEARQVMGGSGRLVSCLFPLRCVRLRDTDTFTISFQYRPSLPAGPNMGFLLFIAHARFDPDVRCRMYGQCAVQKVTLNHIEQLCITQEPKFVLACHPLITGWNELVLTIHRDPMARAKLLVCAYKTELLR